MDFNTFLSKVHENKPRPNGRFKGRLLALDPGETTGWSVWDSHDNATHYELAESGQLPTWDKSSDRMQLRLCVKNFPDLLFRTRPDCVVAESYRVYEWKAESHSWSDVPTLRIIGSIETFMLLDGLPYSFQTAQAAKNFVTDDKLKEWGFWKRGERHARDSYRHALYFILFG